MSYIPGMRTLLTTAAAVLGLAVPASLDASESVVSGGCSFNGFRLYGNVQIVEHFPDIKVQIVEHFPDLKVQQVEHFPDSCGKWKTVEHFPDFKIQIVEHFPDVKIQYVEHFPGLP